MGNVLTGFLFFSLRKSEHDERTVQKFSLFGPNLDLGTYWILISLLGFLIKKKKKKN